jgi:hypothetical protein
MQQQDVEQSLYLSKILISTLGRLHCKHTVKLLTKSEFSLEIKEIAENNERVDPSQD